MRGYAASVTLPVWYSPFMCGFGQPLTLGVGKAWVSKNTAVLKYTDDVRAIARNGFIRDYVVLKKINALKSDKKQQAISSIIDGTFDKKNSFHANDMRK